NELEIRIWVKHCASRGQLTENWSRKAFSRARDWKPGLSFNEGSRQPDLGRGGSRLRAGAFARSAWMRAAVPSLSWPFHGRLDCPFDREKSVDQCVYQKRLDDFHSTSGNTHVSCPSSGSTAPKS